MENKKILKHDDFDQKLIGKMEKNKIAPRPRWLFLFRNCVIWGTGIISLIVGAAAVSTIFYFLEHNDWGMRIEMHKSFLEIFILTLPYFWLVFLGLFIFILYYNIKNTKRGYRYPVWMIILSSVLMSIILGSIFSWAGLGEKIDLILGRRMPLYGHVFNPHIDFWSEPREGRLVGLVVEISEVDSFILIDREQKEWGIIISDNTDFRGSEIIPGRPVRLLGEIISDNDFRADRIMPLMPGKGYFNRFDSRVRPCPRPGMPIMVMPGVPLR